MIKLILAFVAIIFLILVILGIIDVQTLLSEAVDKFFDLLKSIGGLA